jgi:acetylornithine deacetylase
MKSFIGLAVAQAPAFLAAELPFAIHYAFSYDEEVGCFGAPRLIADLRARGIQPLACIVGEPTGMVPALAHKGVYRWRCCIKGRAAHSSLVPQAVNAIEVGARVVGKLSEMSTRYREEGPHYPGFDVPYTDRRGLRHRGRHRRQRRARGLPLPLRVPQPAGQRRRRRCRPR